MKVYTSIEVRKLIRAFQEKYKISGCEKLPYVPESIEVELTATKKVICKRTSRKNGELNTCESPSICSDADKCMV